MNLLLTCSPSAFGACLALKHAWARNILQKNLHKTQSGCEFCSNLAEQRHAT